MASRLGQSRKNGTTLGANKLAICRTLKTGHPVLNDVSTIHVNGSRREINTSATPLLDTAGGVTGCLATISDVTVVASVIRLGQTALKSLNVDDFIEESMDAIMNAASLRLASLYLWDGDELKLRIMKGRHAGMPLPDCRDTPDPANPSLQSRTFLKGKPLLIKDYRRCPSVRLFDPLARKRPVRSMAGVPLTGEGGVIGVLIAATGEGHPMDETTMSGLIALCSQMAAGIDRTLGEHRLPT